VGGGEAQVIDLVALLADPARLADVPPAELPALLAQVAAEQHRLAALGTAVAVRLLETSGNGADRLVGVEEAAERLGVTADWLRRRSGLPFVVKLSEGVVRYSSRGIDHYIAARVDTGAC
jgi:hypothetical protein